MINALDISNVTLLDKIFTLLSFAVKYITKSIKEDLENFYSAYVELLGHKNRFVRKFAAQSFCYVIRKINFDEKLLSIILKPILAHDDTDLSKRALERTLLDKTVGISELLFEVVYGASEGLHSRAKECLEQLLIFQRVDRTPDLISLIRCLFIKLINEVDTEKHQLIYDTLTKTLNWKDDQGDLNLLLTLTQDIIKLKHGRRVTQYGIVIMTEYLNTVLHKNAQKTFKLEKAIKV